MEAPVWSLPPRREDDPWAYEEFYHEHREERVAGGYQHGLISVYLVDALRLHRPGRWVALDLCCYWREGDRTHWLAPDVLYVDSPEPPFEKLPTLRSYRQWEHGPLRFVTEIVSEDSRGRDRLPKPALYAKGLRPDEYLFVDHQRQDLRLYRLVGDLYQRAEPDERGWFYSEVLDLWFGMDAVGWVWVYDGEGRRYLSHGESEQQRHEAEAQRHEAEAQRREAEARAAAEAARAAELEARVAELERRLAERNGA